jgi:hypothetical protein
LASTASRLHVSGVSGFPSALRDKFLMNARENLLVLVPNAVNCVSEEVEMECGGWDTATLQLPIPATITQIAHHFSPLLRWHPPAPIDLGLQLIWVFWGFRNNPFGKTTKNNAPLDKTHDFNPIKSIM